MMRHDETNVWQFSTIYIKSKTINFLPNYERTRQLFPRYAKCSTKCQFKKTQPTCDTKTKNDVKKRVSVAAQLTRLTDLPPTI